MIGVLRVWRAEWYRALRSRALVVTAGCLAIVSFLRVAGGNLDPLLLCQFVRHGSALPLKMGSPVHRRMPCSMDECRLRIK